MGAKSYGIPEGIALYLKDRFALREFVETGTNAGNTAAWAAAHFEKVYTIELGKELHEAARARLGATANIELLYGHSPQRLAALLPQLERPLFWLDAHWSGGDTAGVEAECPLLDELAVIAAAGLARPIILIDDARLFLAPPPAPHRWEQWPDVASVLAACQRCGELYITVVDDIIVAVPASDREAVAGYLRGQV